MGNDKEKKRGEFSRRLNRALDEAGVKDKGHGRQLEVGKMVKVSAGAARKYLEGQGYPDFDKIVILAELLKVNVEWLAKGQGPMRVVTEIYPESSAINVLLLEQVIEESEQGLKEAGIESLSNSKRAKLYGYVYEEALKEGRVDRDMVRRLLRLFL